MSNARSYASVSCESEDICTAQMDEQARLAAVDSLTVHLARAVTRFGLKLADGSGDDTLNVSYAILEQVKRPTSEEAPDEEHAHIFIPLSSKYTRASTSFALYSQSSKSVSLMKP